ncbi:TPA: fimbria/pilus periplasmic chaperone [Yersinia enterocolitica]|nr:fimbria/pilus periplasmic chaperone [Yersinia enterocolitica]HDL7505268.1 fimbria/pilus periplasmic chaperone [Yersinia enterocolitica]HDM8081580.1 fimbria/pilus periplasmic chaperone [Yersinia enterocolitica]
MNNIKNVYLLTLKCFFLIFLPFIFLPCVNAVSADLNTYEHKFAVKIGGTRVVYPLSSVKGVSFSVANPQDYPILVQSQVKGEDKHSSAPFVVTPPLFRLDAGMQGRVRVIRTGGNFPQDRESLQWLCLTGVPPQEGDIWDNSHHDKENKSEQDINLDVRLSVGTCVKLFVRPEKLKQKPEEVAGELIWHRNGEQLQVNNPTPFYISFKSVSLAGKNIDLFSAGGENYVAPFSKRSFSLPVDMARGGGEVNWQIIDDNGGVSQVFKAKS